MTIFDKDNNLTALTDARSVATARTFDAVDRLTGVTITGYSGENETFTYDDTTSGNKGVGRLTSMMTRPLKWLVLFSVRPSATCRRQSAT